ncbi:MAG TPA: DUF6496 domain-containing protein [Cyclobacteriaceae bacterium]|jgi:hypothetical protein|nr:DUF6496 domain-containing protein [Cyclobacteriaceae bacterium]
MTKYSKKAQDTVARAVRKLKKGTLKSGSGETVTNAKQAIAIGISEAKEKGYKVPEQTAKHETTTLKSSKNVSIL